MVSPHGLLFAGLQALFVCYMPLLYAQGVRLFQARKWPADARLPLVLGAAYLIEWAILRYQPIKRGADLFTYELGLFDAVTFTGIVFLVFVHRAHIGRLQEDL